MSPPSSALVKLPKSTPFHLLPLHLRFTFTAAVCETVPQGSSSPLCSTEFSAQAEFSREGSNIEGGTSLESSVPFEPLFAPLRSSCFDSQFNRTVGLDCSMIKIH